MDVLEKFKPHITLSVIHLQESVTQKITPQVTARALIIVEILMNGNFKDQTYFQFYILCHSKYTEHKYIIIEWFDDNWKHSWEKMFSYHG